MSKLIKKFWRSLAMGFALVLVASAAGSVGAAEKSQSVKLKLSGDEEVPAVKTSASGTGSIVVSADKSVSGSITTTGIEGTAAHIHEGAAGKNGGVIIPLTKSADGNTWSVPAGTKLTDAQYETFKEGNLYVNVHSAANKGGEIRAQLKP